MQTAHDNDVIGYSEAAALFGVSTRHLQKLVTRDAIPHFRMGNCVRFSRTKLEQWVRDQIEKTQPASEA
jgi:excisionase family DNA binding protein